MNVSHGTASASAAAIEARSAAAIVNETAVARGFGWFGFGVYTSKMAATHTAAHATVIIIIVHIVSGIT